MNKINVLYICGAGAFCGSTRSLFETLKVLKLDKINPYFITASGTVVPVYSSVALGLIESEGLSKFDNTKYSYYRGRRYLILLRELYYLPCTIVAFWKAKKQFKTVELVHINEITNIPSLILASLFFKVPIIIHVRAIFRDTTSYRSRIILKLLKKYTSAIIAIDENVKKSLGVNEAVTIHNSFNVASSNTDFVLLEKLKKYTDVYFRIGFIGNFLKNKGLNDLLDAAIILKNNHNFKFLILGDEFRKSKSYVNTILSKLKIIENPKQEILNKIQEHKLDNSFILLGKSLDLSSYFKSIDILCFPSHLDAPGRPIFEAAFHCIPSIACISDPNDDTFRNNITGLLVNEKKPEEIANAILKLYNDRPLVKSMGDNVNKLAMSNFLPELNAEKLFKVYSQVLEKSKKK